MSTAASPTPQISYSAAVLHSDQLQANNEKSEGSFDLSICNTYNVFEEESPDISSTNSIQNANPDNTTEKSTETTSSPAENVSTTSSISSESVITPSTTNTTSTVNKNVVLSERLDNSTTISSSSSSNQPTMHPRVASPSNFKSASECY